MVLDLEINGFPAILPRPTLLYKFDFIFQVVVYLIFYEDLHLYYFLFERSVKKNLIKPQSLDSGVCYFYHIA
ncbi:hypothetical protein SAMN06265348_108283 [Pedobacter westerhofensis]|uniref:Uncharacterized protein n=1 Tax=Pedobacter westerhofensis TaxID=425512 RepID=A0A521ELT9_9SPHI|nr:hypothetical protein SAMN06265348_108283 [Pedobacter westerhofensis]